MNNAIHKKNLRKCVNFWGQLELIRKKKTQDRIIGENNKIMRFNIENYVYYVFYFLYEAIKI